MPQARNKTQPTETLAQTFIDGLDEPRRSECAGLVRLMREESGCEPEMWGASIIGFGRYHFHYDSGREGDFMRIGFSPRKTNLSLYLISGFASHEALLQRLGKHSLGKSCLYLKRLSDADPDVLRELVRASLDEMRERYPEEP